MTPVKTKKLYYTIREVSDMTGISVNVIRGWDELFPQLKPIRKSNTRHYRKSDLEIIKQIAELLYTRKFTIAGAQAELTRSLSEPDAIPIIQPPPQLEPEKSPAVPIRRAESLGSSLFPDWDWEQTNALLKGYTQKNVELEAENAVWKRRYEAMHRRLLDIREELYKIYGSHTL